MAAAEAISTGPSSPAPPLKPVSTEDGSFSLFSPAMGEAFHSGRGALAEARHKFVAPAGLAALARRCGCSMSAWARAATAPP